MALFHERQIQGQKRRDGHRKKRRTLQTEYQRAPMGGKGIGEEAYSF